MPTTPTALTACPPVPDSGDDEVTFDAQFEAFNTWLKNDMQPGVNALATNVFDNATEVVALSTTAIAQVALASAAANYKGLWSSLTGTLNMPASVSHNGNYWALNANLADVTTATPGVSANWQPLNVGAGGAAETSSAVDITLTAASYRVQAVAMTAADKSVRLPAATTLGTGAELFVVKNTGALAFTVRDAAGTMLANLNPGKCAALHLHNAAASAGAWAVVGDGIADSIYQATALAVNAASSTHVSVTAMSATQAIACWSGASGYLNCCTLNVSGNVVTAGPVLVVNAVSSSYISVASLSATQAIVAYSGASTFLQACTLNVSGTTLTNGTVLSVNAVASSIFCSVVAMSATQAIVAYSGTSSYTQACTLNVSGTTLTNGTVLSVNAINSSYQAITQLSTTQALIAYSNASGFLTVCTLNVSGTTLTNGTVRSITAADSRFPSLAAVSATQAVIAYTGPTAMFQLNVRTLNISGTDVTAGGIFVQSVTPLQSVFSSLKKLSASKLALISSVDGLGTGSTYSARAQVLGLADGQISGGSAVTLKAAAGSYGALAALSETKALAVYLESSGYVQARILEIGV